MDDNNDDDNDGDNGNIDNDLMIISYSKVKNILIQIAVTLNLDYSHITKYKTK